MPLTDLLQQSLQSIDRPMREREILFILVCHWFCRWLHIDCFGKAVKCKRALEVCYVRLATINVC